MTSDLHAAPERTGAGRPESKARTFARLGKLDVYDYYLSVFVVGAAALPAAGFAAGAEALPMLLLFLLGEVCTLVALVSFDDVTGFRDGSDIANYGPNDPLRKKLRKPLVAGTLSEREAVSYTHLTLPTNREV